MRKKLISNLILCFAASLVAFVVIPSSSYGQEVEEINIVIAPNVVAMNSMGTSVTVHTNIGIGDVDTEGNVLLKQVTDTDVCNLIDENSYIEMSRYEVDDRGNFVAKFLMDDFKEMALCMNEINTFGLEGYTNDQGPFYGTDTVLVNGGSNDPDDPEKDQNMNRVDNSNANSGSQGQKNGN